MTAVMPTVRTYIRQRCPTGIALTSGWKDSLRRAGAGVVIYGEGGDSLCAFAGRDLGQTTLTRTAIRLEAIYLAVELAEEAECGNLEIRVASPWLVAQLSAPGDDAEDDELLDEVRAALGRFESTTFVSVHDEGVIAARDLAAAVSQRMPALPEPAPRLSAAYVTNTGRVTPKVRLPDLVAQTAELRDRLRLTAGTAEAVDTLLEVARDDMTRIWGSKVRASTVSKAIFFCDREWYGDKVDPVKAVMF